MAQLSATIAMAISLWASSDALDFKPCLPDPPARRKLPFKEEARPLVVGAGNWDAPIILGRIAQIILNEGIGIETDFDHSFGGSAATTRGLLGCDDDACAGLGDWPQVHFDFENWYTEAGNALLQAHPNVLKEGFIGYDGQEGLYVLENIAQAVWNSSRLALEYYVCLSHPDRSWMQHFTKPSEISIPEGSGCRPGTAAAELMASQGMPCSADGWWYSPACADDPDTCIPVLMGGIGWLGLEVCHVIKYSNIPMAVSFLAWPDQRLKDGSVSALFFWWRPDWSYNVLGPLRRLLFPKHNRQEWAEGIFHTDFPDFQLKKYMWAGVSDLSPEASLLFDSFELSWMQINELMDQMYARSGGGDPDFKFTLACEWVRANEAVWRPWIQVDKTKCLVGQGLEVGENGEPSCKWCEPATFSDPHPNITGSRICLPCGKGTYQMLPGQSSCEACARGYYMDAPGSTTCTRCAVGFYQDVARSSECKRCAQPRTTIFQSSQAPSDCVCPAESYESAGGACEPCPAGMVCPEANSSETAILSQGRGGADLFPYPRAAPGHMTLASEPLRAYRCNPSEWCPGGPPGACAPHRDPSKVACGLCSDGAYTSSDGTCQPCSGGVGVLLVVIFVLLGLVFCCAVVFLANGNVLQQRHSTMMVVFTLGLTVTSVQAMGVFNNLAVSWAEPLRSIFGMMSVLSFDIGSLQLECTVKPNPLVNYICRQLILPSALVVLAVALLLRKTFVDPAVDYKIELVNTAGSVFQVVFISIVLSCAVPFVCYNHPGDTAYSLLDSQSVLCYESPLHRSMMAAGIISFLLVVCPFIALVLYGTLRYPAFARASSTNQGQGLRAFRFLYFRFRPSRYYYASLLLARGLCVCLIPVVFRDNAVLQVIAMASVFQVFGVLQAFQQPWRSLPANVFDASAATILVLMLVCAATTIDAEGLESIIGVMGSIIFGALVLLFLGVIGFGVYARLVPSPYFHHFICHHKRDASAQSRFLQLSLQACTKQDCFIDSDHLTDLNTLLDIVRCRIGRLVVFLTSDTLKRPWCAGEISVTFSTHRQLTLLRTPSFQAPSREQIQDVGAYLDLEGTNLLEMGISAGLIAAAYAWLLEGTLPCVHLDSKLVGRSRFASLVDQLVGSISGRGSNKEAALGSGMLVFSSDPADDEATAACGILVSKLQADIMGLMRAGICVLADLGGGREHEVRQVVQAAHAVVVVLSGGSLQSGQQLDVIVAAMAADEATALIPVSTSNFRFPGDRSYADALPTHMPNSRAQLQGALQRFFKLITVYLATNASDKVLQAQANEVLARIQLARTKTRLQGWPAASSGTEDNRAQTEEEEPGGSIVISIQEELDDDGFTEYSL